MANSSRKAPWKTGNPRQRRGTSRKLTPAQKTQARKRAAAAGRPYPNLVENMQAARGSRTASPKPRGSATKDPHGGLTAAGRASFRRRDGAHLRPGVKKSARDMTALDKKRKGSWAVRFYGRAGRLPPLKDKAGKPTRFALTAAAWGEPVPGTVAAARKIAAKGRRLLAQYQKEKSKRPRSR